MGAPGVHNPISSNNAFVWPVDWRYLLGRMPKPGFDRSQMTGMRVNTQNTIIASSERTLPRSRSFLKLGILFPPDLTMPRGSLQLF